MEEIIPCPHHHHFFFSRPEVKDTKYDARKIFDKIALIKGKPVQPDDQIERKIVIEALLEYIRAEDPKLLEKLSEKRVTQIMEATCPTTVSQVWFSEIYLPHFRRKDNPFLVQAEELVDNEGKLTNWCKLFYDRQTSVQYLNQLSATNHQSNAFVLRFSVTHPRSFALDLMINGTIKHYSIDNTPEGYRLDRNGPAYERFLSIFISMMPSTPNSDIYSIPTVYHHVEDSSSDSSSQ